MDKKLDTGAEVIDQLIGGFETGVISTVYGAAGTGKTNVAMLAAISVAKKGKKVIFIDTEGGFSIERCKQICDDEKVMKNLEILKPTDFEEQKKIIREIRQVVEEKKIELVVVDSLTMLYRLDRPDNPQEINLELTKQLSILSSLARKKDIAILVTNQVYSEFDKRDEVNMVGGDILKYWSKCILKLEKIGWNLRKIQIIKHRSLPEGKSAFFEITDSGFKEAEKPKDEKKFSLF